MQDATSQHYRAFREEVRRFIEDNLTDEMREAGRLQTGFPDVEQSIAWQKVRHQRGWAAPSWPKEYGGPGWDEIQQTIFREEACKANAPTEHLQSLMMCGPCLMGHGSQEQKDYYLPKILSGEHIWCQGYSEPGAGSDLASLTTSAVVEADSDGDDYIVNGQKIWTSNAHEATHMFCLVRTSTQGRPQQGITFLLIDMQTPGITVEPIISLSGVHEQNTVFLDNVRVPQVNRVGEENDGWTVAKYLLEFERGTLVISPMLRKNLGLVRLSAANETTADGQALLDDRVFRRKLAELEIDMDILEFNENRLISAAAEGHSPGLLASLVKIVSGELVQGIDKLGTEAAGLHSLVYQPEAMVPGDRADVVGPDHALIAMPRYLDNRGVTIAGGSSEVQRNILAKSVLGL
jgi:alkylation response protein AidB-like acyl-CoA dehydrogenase